MNREQLEHIIRAAGDVLGETEVIVIGSQAILVSFPDSLPRTATVSMEADIMALDDPEGRKALIVNGAIGELTHFQEQFGVYAEGVEDGLARLPAGWRDRLVPVSSPNTNGVTGWCLEPHDLCVSKLLANRTEAGDISYVRALVQAGNVKPETLLERLEFTQASDQERKQFVEYVRGFRKVGRSSSLRRALRRVDENQSASVTDGDEEARSKNEGTK